MNLRNFRRVQLLVLVQITAIVHTQDPSDDSMEAVISDATREVSARRSGGLAQVQKAATGKNVWLLSKHMLTTFIYASNYKVT